LHFGVRWDERKAIAFDEFDRGRSFYGSALRVTISKGDTARVERCKTLALAISRLRTFSIRRFGLCPSGSCCARGTADAESLCSFSGAIACESSTRGEFDIATILLNDCESRKMSKAQMLQGLDAAAAANAAGGEMAARVEEAVLPVMTA
jgi:hypothetical protein